MATINDVYNQLVTVNATLSSINADVNAGTVATTAVKTEVQQLDTDLKDGFAATTAALASAVTALNAIWTIDYASAQLLSQLTQQTDTIICALEHISQNTCALLTQSTIQTTLQTEIRKDAHALVSIAEVAYPAGALDSRRLTELEAQIHKCCPADIPPPACTYEPCPKPKSVPVPQLPTPPKATRPPG